jgi:hypothetical protein
VVGGATALRGPFNPTPNRRDLGGAPLHDEGGPQWANPLEDSNFMATLSAHAGPHHAPDSIRRRSWKSRPGTPAFSPTSGEGVSIACR